VEGVRWKLPSQKKREKEEKRKRRERKRKGGGGGGEYIYIFFGAATQVISNPLFLRALDKTTE
jgi:hypothetical protein